MTDLVRDDGRTHIVSNLMRESLQDRSVLARTKTQREHEILPDVVLVGIGGQSIFDRGREALLPLADEIASTQRDCPILLGVGGGTGSTYAIDCV